MTRTSNEGKLSTSKTQGEDVRIAFDIDNVLACIITSARTVLASDLKIPVGEIILTEIYQSPFSHRNPTLARSLKVDHAFWDRPEVLIGCPVLPGALEAVRLAQRSGALAAYITRRPEFVRFHTQSWLNEHGFPNAPLHHVGTTNAQTTYETCKSTACKIVGATHLIDDHATEFTTARAAGIEVVVVDAPVGRAARMAAMANTPDALLAKDAYEAVQLILGPDRMAA